MSILTFKKKSGLKLKVFLYYRFKFLKNSIISNNYLYYSKNIFQNKNNNYN